MLNYHRNDLGWPPHGKMSVSCFISNTACWLPVYSWMGIFHAISGHLGKREPSGPAGDHWTSTQAGNHFLLIAVKLMVDNT